MFSEANSQPPRPYARVQSAEGLAPPLVRLMEPQLSVLPPLALRVAEAPSVPPLRHSKSLELLRRISSADWSAPHRPAPAGSAPAVLLFPSPGGGGRFSLGQAAARTVRT